jgi:hypothetical protein
MTVLNDAARPLDRLTSIAGYGVRPRSPAPGATDRGSLSGQALRSVGPPVPWTACIM